MLKIVAVSAALKRWDASGDGMPASVVDARVDASDDETASGGSERSASA